MYVYNFPLFDIFKLRELFSIGQKILILSVDKNDTGHFTEQLLCVPGLHALHY